MKKQTIRSFHWEPLESRALMATAASPLSTRIVDHVASATIGRVGLSVLDLSDLGGVSLRGTSVFGTSSTIKLGVLYALMRRVDRDPAVSLTTTLNVGAQYGTNQGDTLTANTSYTLRQLAETMIDNSNNWATNRLMDYLGVSAINAEFRDLGLNSTRIDRYNTGTGSPSMHGLGSSTNLPGPTRDYRAGFDNESTPNQLTTLLRLVHENDGLLTSASRTAFWDIMERNGSGYLTREYADSVFRGPGVTWGSALDLASKGGSNTWSGSPGTFTDDPTIGDHFQRSEAGRIVFADGRVVFYAMFVDEAPDATIAETAMGRVGFEIAREYAPATVTVTPAGAELEDGRVALIRGTSGADDFRVEAAAGGAVAMRIGGQLIQQVSQPLGTAYAMGMGDADRFELAAQPATRVVLDGGTGDDQLVYRGPGQRQTTGVTTTVTRPGFAEVRFVGIESSFAAPTILVPGDRSVQVGTAIDPLTVSVADPETAGDALIVTASSSNPALVPDAAITVSGSGATRTLRISPVAGATGSAAITVRVEDETGQSATATFQITVTAIVPPPDTTPPRVVRVDRTKLRTGVGRKRKVQDALIVTLSEPIDPIRAANPGNYRLTTAGRDRRFGTRDDKRVALGSVAVDAAGLQVTLVAKTLLAAGQSYQLVSGSAGLVDRALNLLDGDGDGLPGGDHVFRFGRRALG